MLKNGNRYILEKYKHKINPKVRHELRVEFLPKIAYVKSKLVLRRPNKKMLNYTASLPDVGPLQKSMDVTSKELLDTTEWMAEADQDGEIEMKDKVRHLEYWNYKKTSPLHQDSEYRRILREKISKQIAERGEELLNPNEMFSYIIWIITNQLNLRKKFVDNENSPILDKLSILGGGTSPKKNEIAIKEIQQYRESMEKSKRESLQMEKLTTELMNELQTLRLKKEADDKKNELKTLLERNKNILKNIDEREQAEENLEKKKKILNYIQFSQKKKTPLEQ